MPLKSYKLGKLIVTTCYQGSGAPFIDKGMTKDLLGNKYPSRIILLTPWRRRSGQSEVQRALVIGWLDEKNTKKSRVH